jgi:stage V sporulation protein R
MNEGWASYWHETLYLDDDRINGHEVDFARVNAGVTSMPRVGLNPYALGMRLFYNIEEMVNKGQLSWEFQNLKDSYGRKHFDNKVGGGRQFIFDVRQNYCDFTFINQFVDQDFITRNNLFVAGKRLNEQRMVWQYFVKSRKARDYRDMLFASLYHPPHVSIDHEKGEQAGTLYLVHKFEGKPLVKDYIPNTLLGLEYLWGGPVELETHEVKSIGGRPEGARTAEIKPQDVKWQRVVLTMKDRRLSRRILG